MNEITVSILIPVYNVEKYIERCARSIFEQTYQNLEIIFVDDCTPDNSIEILRRVLGDYPYRQPQTHIIRHDHNRGLGAARNTAMDAATGDYIYFIDSDDKLFDSESLDKLISVAKLFKLPDIIVGNTKPEGFPRGEMDWMSLSIYKVPDYCDDAVEVKKMLLKRRTYKMTAWNKMYKTTFIRNYQLYFEEGILFEDECWNFFLAKVAKSVAVCKETTYVYYCNSSGIMLSGGNKAKRVESYKWMLLLMSKHIDDMCVNEQIDCIDTIYHNFMLKYHVRIKELEHNLITHSHDKLRQRYQYFVWYHEVLAPKSPIYLISLAVIKLCHLLRSYKS